jgi:hypothetical protein
MFALRELLANPPHEGDRCGRQSREFESSDQEIPVLGSAPWTAPMPEAIAQSGRVRFAGILVILLGGFNLIQGIAAAAKEEIFAVTPDGLLVWDYDGWAAVWFVLGAVQVLVGLGILGGRQWARVVGIVILMVVAMFQIAFLVAFPLWAVLSIALAVTAINALLVHGEAFGSGRQVPDDPYDRPSRSSS